MLGVFDVMILSKPDIIEYIELSLFQTKRFHVLVHDFYSFRGIYW